MKKIAQIAPLIVFLLVLAGCSVNIETPRSSPLPFEFTSANGTIIESVRNISAKGLNLVVEINFEKISGKLDYEISSPSGKTIEIGVLASNFEPHKNLPQETKEKWGVYKFSKVAEEAGDYKITIKGDNASGSVQVVTANYFGFTGFSGIVAEATAEANSPEDKISFSFNAKYTDGIINAKVYDPLGKELSTSRLEKGKEIDEPIIFDQKAGQTGVFKAVLEAENSTGQALIIPFKKNDIPSLAFLRPTLFLLLGLLFIFLVGKGNGRVFFWGAMIFLISQFVGGITGEFVRTWMAGMVIFPLAILVPILFAAGTSAFIQMFGLTFTKYIAEMKTISPRELFGFLAGFVVVEPFLAAFSGFSAIYKLNGMLSPYPFGSPIPGLYPSSESALYDLALPFLQRGFAMLEIIALGLLVVWAVRRKEQKGLPTWAIVIFAMIGKAVIDVLLTYTNYLPILGRRSSAFWESFQLGNFYAQGLAITAILAVFAVIVYYKRQSLAKMLNESCEVTIDAFKQSK
jgi:hypothetical protein